VYVYLFCLFLNFSAEIYSFFWCSMYWSQALYAWICRAGCPPPQRDCQYSMNNFLSGCPTGLFPGQIKGVHLSRENRDKCTGIRNVSVIKKTYNTLVCLALLWLLTVNGLLYWEPLPLLSQLLLSKVSPGPESGSNLGMSVRPTDRDLKLGLTGSLLFAGALTA